MHGHFCSIFLIDQGRRIDEQIFQNYNSISNTAEQQYVVCTCQTSKSIRTCQNISVQYAAVGHYLNLM